jgi:hypothetical protein
VLHESRERAEQGMRIAAGQAEPGQELLQRHCPVALLDGHRERAEIVRTEPLELLVDRHPGLDRAARRSAREPGRDVEECRQVRGVEELPALGAEVPADRVIVDHHRKAAADVDRGRGVGEQGLLPRVPLVAREQEKPVVGELQQVADATQGAAGERQLGVGHLLSIALEQGIEIGLAVEIAVDRLVAILETEFRPRQDLRVLDVRLRLGGGQGHQTRMEPAGSQQEGVLWEAAEDVVGHDGERIAQGAGREDLARVEQPDLAVGAGIVDGEVDGPRVDERPQRGVRAQPVERGASEVGEHVADPDLLERRAPQQVEQPLDEEIPEPPRSATQLYHVDRMSTVERREGAGGRGRRGGAVAEPAERHPCIGACNPGIAADVVGDGAARPGPDALAVIVAPVPLPEKRPGEALACFEGLTRLHALGPAASPRASALPASWRRGSR